MRLYGTVPTQYMVVAGLTSVINSVCCGKYAVTKQHVDDGVIIFGSQKPDPNKVPRLVSMGESVHSGPYMDMWVSGDKKQRKETPFFKDIALVQGLARKAAKFAERKHGSERVMRRESFSLAQQAANADVRGDREFAARTSIASGMLLAQIDRVEERFLAQDMFLSGARISEEDGRPIAGAVALNFAAGLSAPWNNADGRTTQLRRGAAHLFAESVETIRDPASLLDRLFFGLVNKPDDSDLVSLLLNLVSVHEARQDELGIAGDLLRLGLSIAKTENPDKEEWLNVALTIDTALSILWHADGNILFDIDEIYPEIRLAEETAGWASHLSDTYFLNAQALQRRRAQAWQSFLINYRSFGAVGTTAPGSAFEA